MKKMKKLIPLFLVLVFVLAGCAGKASVNVVSREDGSGTRGAFVEITGLLEKEGDQEIDTTYEEATIQNTTDGVMTTVKGDIDGIGYVSTGSLNDTIKALKVNGVEPSQENIKKGDYPISRPFLLAFKGELNPLQEDFLKFILSQEGQALVKDQGYIPVDAETSYQAGDIEGKITISGSTSVTPVIEKLKEEYEALNPKASIEIQSNGSSTGIKSTIDGASDLAMSSRSLKEDEKQSLTDITIALDGIGVIVNKDNPIEDLSLEEVKEIFKGNITSWDDLNN